MIDLITEWTQADTPLPHVTVSYVISPLPGIEPTMWRLDRGSIEGGACFVMSDAAIGVTWQVYFAHGLTGAQRANAIESFGRIVEGMAAKS